MMLRPSFVFTRLNSPVAPGPALEFRSINPGADTEFTLGDLDLVFNTIRGFAASAALSGNL
jgi:hypothetical protein